MHVKMGRIRFLMLVFFSCLIFQAIAAEPTLRDELGRQLNEEGVENTQQVIKSVEQSLGVPLSGISLSSQVDFSQMPEAKIAVTPLDYPAVLVITPDVSGYVFTGKPTTFQGSLRKYEFFLGQGLANAAKMIYPQAFTNLTLLEQVPYQTQRLAIIPSIEHFEFRFGGAWTPVMYATVTLKVKLMVNGRLVHENSYKIKDVKEGTHSLFPTKKQQHRAISTALVETLKMSATEAVSLHAVHAALDPGLGAAGRGRDGTSNSVAPSQASDKGEWQADDRGQVFSDETKAWISQNQHQIARSENQSVRGMLSRKELAAPPQEGNYAEEQTVSMADQEGNRVEEEESTYVPLPGPYSFVPTELEKKQWAVRKAEMELRRAEREAEERRQEREYKMDLLRINEQYSTQLNDGTWIYNNAVSEAIIDHGETIITGSKVIVATAACVGPQAAATCAPVAGAMVSYGRFDSLAKGVGEGTAEYQRSGSFTSAVSTGVVSGGLDQLSGMAGGVVTKNRLVRDRFGTSADIVRKRAFKKTQSATSHFVPGRPDLRIKTHLYKADKAVISEGLETFSVQGIGAELGKNMAGSANKSATQITAETVSGVPYSVGELPQGRVLGEENE